jgi:hypothetical protein
MQFSPLLSYLVTLEPKYLPQHLILEDPQSVLLPQCDEPSFIQPKQWAKLRAQYMTCLPFWDAVQSRLVVGYQLFRTAYSFRLKGECPWGPPILLYNGYRVSSPGVEQPGHGINHLPPSSTKVKERVELYSPSGPSWPLLRWMLSLLYLMHVLLLSAAKNDHSDCDCFLLAVLSHGEMGIIYSRETAYKPESLWTPFTADKCPTLAGKPKLFFLQVK